MNWFTTFQIPKAQPPIAFDAKILSLGSCFAQVIGEQLSRRKFKTLINPFGTLFNPISIAKVLEDSLMDAPLDTSLINEREGLFFHYNYHSDLNAKTKAELVEKIKKVQAGVRDFLQSADVLILTFGTGWIYSLADSNEVLANCHKQPQSLFEKRLLTLEEMYQATKSLLMTIQERNPNLRVILTVSPVRHTKDGVPENQLSKSLLRVLCDSLSKSSPQAEYFPAYEIMMDELRDYRFYKSDQIHPSQEAEEYIWNRWTQTYFSEATLKKVVEIERIQAQLQHRPLNPESQNHRQFLQKLLEKLERLAGEFDFSTEIKSVNQQLKDLSEN
ncbi:GSCFA domain-containing protein [Algoriphagus namhaensis]|uniref:GSCFA domain-containing protein n=1 Tax=Algoriphagus namhaensis TaxID=915353 RepID=A0ABV8AV32_9BACT